MALRVTDEQSAEMARLLAAGMNYTDIGIKVGLSPDTVKRHTDPDYYRYRTARKVEAQRRKAAAQKQAFPGGILHDAVDSRALKSDVAARLAEIPEDDNRSLTAMLMGDPMPNDRRRNA